MSRDTNFDEQERRPQSEAAKLAREVNANDWRTQMASKIGRRLIWSLLDKAGVFRTSFTGNSETFFKEGMRNMGLFILDEIQTHAPEALALMLAEARVKA